MSENYCIFVIEKENNTMELNEIRQRIAELTKEKDMLEGNLQEAMVSAIQEISKENHYGVKKISKHISFISLSQMMSGIWSPKFYDWEDSAKSVLNYLSGTPAINWKKKLTDLLETNGDVVKLNKRGIIWPGHTGIVETIPIDRVFIEKIIEKI